MIHSSSSLRRATTGGAPFMRLLKQAGWVLLISIILLGAPRLGGLFADLFTYARIDPDGAFAWVSVHHIVQALIVFGIMVLLTRTKNIDFGFGWGDRAVGFWYVRLFTLIFIAYVAVSMIIVLTAGTFQTFPYPLTARNIVGQMAFQLFLSGPSEELIFRSFAITMLALSVKGSLPGKHVSSANFIAAIVFGLAHVAVTLSPFALTYHPFQVVYAIGLGIVYGICYEKSGSVYYPMMMHSITNVFAVGVSVIATAMIA